MITIKAMNIEIIFRYWISDRYSLKFQLIDNKNFNSFIFQKHVFSNFKSSYIKNQKITKSHMTFVYQKQL